jgi:hypothetical protein
MKKHEKKNGEKRKKKEGNKGNEGNEGIIDYRITGNK